MNTHSKLTRTEVSNGLAHRTIKSTMLAAAALALSAVAASAGGAPASMRASGAAPNSNDSILLSKNYRFTFTEPGEHSFPAGKTKIPGGTMLDTFAVKYPNGLYFCCYGLTISGPSSASGFIAEAVQFTAAKTGKVKTISAGVGIVNGINSVDLYLYADNGGQVGAEIDHGVANNMPAFGTCCGTVGAPINANLVAGTKYWVGIVGTNANWDSANFSTIDQVNPHTMSLSTAVDNNGDPVWQAAQNYILQPAVEVH